MTAQRETPRPVLVAGGSPDARALGERLAELLDAPLETVIAERRATAAALAETAARRQAAVVVLGPTHRRWLARTLRGTARRLLMEAACPVAVAPAGYADRPPRPVRCIGAAYEPTPEAGRALEAAHDLATRADGTLLVIGVALPLSPLAVDDLRDRAPYLETERRIVQAGLDRAVALLPPRAEANTEAHIGDPAVELAAASASLDLLVCGSRRRSPARAILLGSVTERLLRNARCPLLVVPRPQAQVRRPERRMRSAVLPPPRG